MRGIDLSRVVVGGLLAGLVINIGEFLFNGVLFAADMEAAMARLNLPMPGTSAIAIFVLSGFAVGIVAVWLYAAIRARFGPGVNTALCAGSTVWFLACVYPSISFVVMGFIPARLIAIGVIWTLVEVLVATVAGAWWYQEQAEVTTRRVNA